MIKIYSREFPPCAKCNMAINIAESKGLEYEKILVGERPGELPTRKFQQMFPEAREFPVITIDESKDNIGIQGLQEQVTSKQLLNEGLSL